ncbi:hypothetical protein ACHQM5_018117 [Ranunculus cassubicifolius]
MTMGKKTWGIKKKMSSKRSWWPWRRLFTSKGFQWKRLDFKRSFYDNVIFGVISVFEAIFLVGSLCFFFCCCGCHL